MAEANLMHIITQIRVNNTRMDAAKEREVELWGTKRTHEQNRPSRTGILGEGAE